MAKNTGEKLLELGLGAMVLTKEKVEKAVKTLEQKGKIGKTDAKKLIDQLIKKGEGAKKDLDKKMETVVKSVLKSMNLATKKEVDNLKAEIAKLKKSKPSKSKK